MTRWHCGRLAFAGHSLGAIGRRQAPWHGSWPAGHEDAGGEGEGGEAAEGGETDEHVPQRTGQLVAMVALKL